MTLFPQDRVIGTFRGFSEGGLEFHADLVLPYNPDFTRTAMHGQFVLVALEHDNEAALGRITTVSSEGRLVSPVGEDYAARAVLDDRPIPDDLRERFLKYKVDIRVLGVIRREGDKIVFAASHRRLPHVGSKVAFLSDELIVDVAGATAENGGAAIGYLAMGEYIYAGNDDRLEREAWMQVIFPAVTPTFDVSALVSRRSFVFARAGFGKSNLNKLLFSELYRNDPTVEKRGRRVPVGTVIFDPEGEYFWPDDKGRPGFCDIDHLRDRLVVFTNRAAPSDAYGSFVVDGVKMDIRELPPSRVVGIVLPEERQEQQNVLKLKQLSRDKWRQLVDLVATHKHNADLDEISKILGLPPQQSGLNVEALAARSNMARIIATLHDPNSQMRTELLAALAEGKLCVVDISQMRGKAGLDLAGIILAEIFEHNQEQFTAAQPQTIPTIAVIEEAQAVLGNAQARGEGPFIEWVKEGRKYDLGAVLVTQQPGSISSDILSQGDNWFIFHLLSQGDLRTLKNANAHFSDDLLASLLNEPLPGHGIYWSSARQRPYPLPIRVFDFTASHRDLLDPDNSGGPLDIYAAQLRERFARSRNEAAARADAALAGVDTAPGEVVAEPLEGEGVEGVEEDLNSRCTRAAIAALDKRAEFHAGVGSDAGLPWWQVQQWLTEFGPYPPQGNQNWDWAYTIVARALDEVLGVNKWRTERRPNPKDPTKEQSFVFKSQ